MHERSSYGRSGDVRGFSTDASVSAKAGDKERRRIVGYCTRPPFADKQVTETCDGRIAFELRHPRSNGATHVVMSEIGFAKKLAALVPPPKQHRARYFGVLSSASALRARVVPWTRAVVEVESPAVPAPSLALDARAASPRRALRAALLRRVYDVDGLRCPACPSGCLRIIAAINEARVIRKILTHLGLDDEPPHPKRTLELRWTDP